MPDRPVISNTTPLVSLWLLNHLDLLRDLYGEIFIPPTVHSEFLATEMAVRQMSLTGAPWIRVAPLTQPRRVLAYAGLDRGEAEVLALAEEQSARLVLIDERAGRRYARRMGLPFTGTLGVLLLAKESGLIQAVKPLIEMLHQAGMYLGEDLIEGVLRLAEE
jgi:predicted nucleic acid-binding protein